VKRLPITYTWSGDFAIAYQIVGNGPIDLVYVPPWASNLDGIWMWNHHARFLNRLASFSRLILYDPRGWGCSDRVAPGQAVELEDHVVDLIAVLDAANAGRPAMFVSTDMGEMGLLAAATHPERFQALVLFNVAAKEVGTSEEPFWGSPADYEAMVESIRRSTDWDAWSRMFVRDALPSHGADEEAIAWFSTMGRLTEGPGSVVSHLRKEKEHDVRDRLGDIRARTLILSRGSTPWRDEGARYIADHIQDARLMRLDGEDLHAWAGNWEPVVDEIQRFLTGSLEPPEPELSVATLLFTDIVSSTALAAELGDTGWHARLQRHHEVVRALLRQHQGTEVDTAGDGFFAAFASTGRAIRCAIEMIAAVPELGLEIRAGVHTGEVEHAVDGLRGIAVHIAARVMSLAGPSELLVSSTVRELSIGSGLTFEDAGERELKGVPDRWHLYRVVTERT
jgi:class 3 adenylate cyclase